MLRTGMLKLPKKDSTASCRTLERVENEGP